MLLNHKGSGRFQLAAWLFTVDYPMDGILRLDNPQMLVSRVTLLVE